MQFVKALVLAQALLAFLLGTLNAWISLYIAIKERKRFKFVGAMFAFLAIGCYLDCVNQLIYVADIAGLAQNVLGLMSVSCVLSANVMVIFFWIHFTISFYSMKPARQKTADAVQYILLALVNGGHFVFGFCLHYQPNQDTMLIWYRSIMLGILCTLELIVMILGATLWKNLHKDADKGFYNFATKIAKVLVTVASLGFLWMFRYIFVLRATGHPFLIGLDAVVLYLHFFGRQYVIMILSCILRKEGSVLVTPEENSSGSSRKKKSSSGGDTGTGTGTGTDIDTGRETPSGELVALTVQAV